MIEMQRGSQILNARSGQSCESNPEKQSSTPLVLVVDDHEDSLLLTSYVLEDMGLNYVTLKNGIDFMLALQTMKPDLILMDIVLPDMNGFDVLRIIRRNFKLPQTPIVAVTAWTNPTAAEHIKNGGFSNYLPKPFCLKALKHLILSLLQKHPSENWD